MKAFYYLIVLIVINSSCHNAHTTKDIVLKIGKLEITSYEVRRQFDKTLNTSQLTIEDMEMFKYNLVNKYLMIHDAYVKRYDTLKEVKNNVNAMANYMMVHPQQGYLWKEIITPVVNDSAQVTADDINKRNKLFYFNILQSDNKETILNFNGGDTIITNVQDFNRLAKKSENYSNILTKYLSIQWPFYKSNNLASILYNMNVGDISPLLESNGLYYFFYLDKTEMIHSGKEDIAKLHEELKIIKEQHINSKLDNKMLTECNPILNHNTLNKIEKFIAKNHSIDSFPENEILITYNLNGTQKKVYLNDLIQYRKYTPSEIITTKIQLENAIKKYFHDDYYCNMARSLGLYNNEIFLMDQTNFEHNLLHRLYIHEEISKNIKINTQDINEYYETHRNDFRTSKFIIANCYYFNRKQDAMKNIGTLQRFYQNNPPNALLDKSKLEGIKNITPNCKLDKRELKNSLEFYDYSHLNNIKAGSISKCIKIYDDFAIIICINEDDFYIQDLQDAQNRIRQIITEIRIQDSINEHYEKLREKYTIEIDLINIARLKS